MRLLIVSNRLPIVADREGENWTLQMGSGGLVTALEPILRARGGIWIGWPGVTSQEGTGIEEPLEQYSRGHGYELVPVLLDQEDLHGFYHGFSNEIIWPLFHDLQSLCNFVPEYWGSYRNVIGKFAEVCVRHARPDDFIWVQDYHLMSLGQRLVEERLRNPLGFFLHIPFPPPDIFSKLPWRSEVLENLLWYNAIGVQTPRDLENFLDCVRKLLPVARIARHPGGFTIAHRGRSTNVGAFPIGINYEDFANRAAADAVSQRVQQLHTEFPNQQIILGVDRLDYTKGIPYRLRAYRLALQRYPDLHRNVVLLQVVVPSREAVPQYQELKAEIERLVAQINGEFTQPGWVPIHYVFRSVEGDELLAFYRVADVGFVTPLKDGMNLVAKEYCACQVEGDGVLILSEFAGAAEQLRRGAILVNPYDLDGVAEALNRGVRMPRKARRPAMRRLRNLIKRHDVNWWAGQFLRACGLSPAGGEPGTAEATYIRRRGEQETAAADRGAPWPAGAGSV